MAEWISVEKQRPDWGTLCWVYIPSDGPNSVSHCWFDADPDLESDDVWGFECAHYHLSEKIVTHWMLYYTPEPPETVVKE